MTREQIDFVNAKAGQPMTVIGETIVDEMIKKFGEEAVLEELCKNHIYVNRRLRPWEIASND